MKNYHCGAAGFRPVFYRMKTFLLVAFGVFVFSACSKSADIPVNATDPCGSQKSFASDVQPVIQASCATSGCHGATSQNGPGPLVTYSQIFNARSSILSAVSSGRMPPNGNLSASAKSTIICWINNGSPEN
jgi:hypothetical protein